MQAVYIRKDIATRHYQIQDNKTKSYTFNAVKLQTQMLVHTVGLSLSLLNTVLESS